MLLAAKIAQCETLKQRLNKIDESVNSWPPTQTKRSHVTPTKDIILLGGSFIRDIEGTKTRGLKSSYYPRNKLGYCKLIICNFKFLRPQKNMKLVRGGHFEFQ